METTVVTLPETATNARDYKGHKVILQHNWEFEVIGPEFDNQKYSIKFKSFSDAREEIDKRIADRIKIEAKNLKMNIRALDDRGNEVTITSIDRRSSDLTGVETQFVYPFHPRIKDALSRRNLIREELNNLERLLSEVRLQTSRGYGRIDAENYGRKMVIFQRAYDERLAKIQELTKPKEVKAEEPKPATV